MDWIGLREGIGRASDGMRSGEELCGVEQSWTERWDGMGGNDRGSHVGKYTQAHHRHAYGSGRERYTGDIDMGRSESYTGLSSQGGNDPGPGDGMGYLRCVLPELFRTFGTHPPDPSWKSIGKRNGSEVTTGGPDAKSKGKRRRGAYGPDEGRRYVVTERRDGTACS